MYCTVLSAAIRGTSVFPVAVETDISNGLPVFQMVGYLGYEVKEAKDRVRTAIRNSGITIPPRRITVNLAPADLRKHGAAFDLPIAVSILSALGYIPAECLNETMIIGEVSLNGDVNQVPGILPVVQKARELGCTRILLPDRNEKEGAVVSGIDVIGVSSIIKAMEYLNNPETILPAFVDHNQLLAAGEQKYDCDFSEIKGQVMARRAAEIAAAGMHHLLLVGQPGAGKTMIAKRIPTIFPRLSLEESIEVSGVYSIMGLLTDEVPLIVRRPFCAPHHTITKTALIGGGRIPAPGLVSLADKGILFLDEMAEFRTDVLENLRQPLEEKKVNIVRSAGTYVYPANFLMVGAMNLCKCGYYPDRSKCNCTAASIQQYMGKISGPLLERIDLCVETEPVNYDMLISRQQAESSAVIRSRVKAAHEKQKKRFRNDNIRFNGEMQIPHIRKYCLLGREEELFMKQVFAKMDMSARVYHKILKTARTIADLEGSSKIRQIHLSEAVMCRTAEYGAIAEVR